MAVISLREEVTEVLQELIRLDTTNPPGNETRAAEFLREYLGDNGVESELFARVPERANLVARIRGGNGPRVLLLSHTDVVLADPAEWQADPFGGELRDGEVWGRGALDMKGQVAAEAVAIASLAREGFEPTGAHISVDDRTVLVISTLVSAGLKMELTSPYRMMLSRDVSNLLNRFTKA